MNKKLKEVIIIILVTIILFIIGYVIFNRYNDNKIKDTNDNYYNAEYLFNNGYIENPNNIDQIGDNNNSIYAYLDKDNVLYIRDISNNLNLQVTGLPEKINLKIYYNFLFDNKIELATLKDNELYYAKVSLDNTKQSKFTKVSDNAKDIYVISNSTDLNSKFVINTNELELKKITYVNKKYILKENIEQNNPYFDYICFDKDNETCNNTKINITFDNKIVVNNEIVKNKDKEIIIKNIFGTVNNSEKKDYELKIYIITFDNKIYTLNNNEVNLYSKKEVRDVKFQMEDDIINSVFIDYKDNSNELISNNDYILTSTLYTKTEKIID